jgi:hypothetical protein
MTSRPNPNSSTAGVPGSGRRMVKMTELTRLAANTAIVVRTGRWIATVNSPTSIAPPASSEYVETAISTSVRPTGQRRRSQTAITATAPVTWSAVNNHSGSAGGPGSCSRESVTSRPNTAATRNSPMSTSQSRRLRRTRFAPVPSTCRT